MLTVVSHFLIQKETFFWDNHKFGLMKNLILAKLFWLAKIWKDFEIKVVNCFYVLFFKVGLSLSKKIFFIFFSESPLKVMKNAFISS